MRDMAGRTTSVMPDETTTPKPAVIARNSLINYQNWPFLLDKEHVPVPNLSRGKIITNQYESKSYYRLDIHGIVYVMVGPNTIYGQDKEGYCEEKAKNDANCLEWEYDEGYQGVKRLYVH